jgi:nicotinic acid mononucleotide adenylyltransferase
MIERDDTRPPLTLFRDYELANSEKKVYWVIGVDSIEAMEKRLPRFFNEVKFMVIPSAGYIIPDAYKFRGNLEVTADKITPMQSGLARRLLATYKKHYTDLNSFEAFVEEFAILNPRVAYYIATNEVEY